MTSQLEQYRRKLADAYMAEHPGVTRQEAKRRVESRAQLVLNWNTVSDRVRGAAAKVFGNTYAERSFDWWGAPPEDEG